MAKRRGKPVMPALRNIQERIEPPLVLFCRLPLHSAVYHDPKGLSRLDLSDIGQGDPEIIFQLG